jgi:hypothetical protein
MEIFIRRPILNRNPNLRVEGSPIRLISSILVITKLLEALKAIISNDLVKLNLFF